MKFKIQINGIDIPDSILNTSNYFDWQDFVILYYATSSTSIINIIAYNDFSSIDDLYLDSISFVENVAPCLNKGTKILCIKDSIEIYIPIELLKKGDIVKTYKHGSRKIYDIIHHYLYNKPTFFGDCMYIMKKENNIELIEDLILTGGHSLLIDHPTENEQKYALEIFGQKFFIDEKQLIPTAAILGFSKILERKMYIYYQLAIENNRDNDQRFGIWANGVLVETPSVNQFNNLFKNN